MLLDRGETFMIIATKITLPTVDIVTDWLSIIKVFTYPRTWKRTELHAVGYAMICVMVLSWIMTIPHFLRIEKSWRQRLKGLPFLMLSSWPQYRGFRLLWLAHWTKNESKLNVEKKEFEQNLSHVGKKWFNLTQRYLICSQANTQHIFAFVIFLNFRCCTTFRYTMVFGLHIHSIVFFNFRALPGVHTTDTPDTHVAYNEYANVFWWKESWLWLQFGSIFCGVHV